jgi:hypothetical protein
MDWLTFLKDVIATQQFLQIFVGGCTMMLIGRMVTRPVRDHDRADHHVRAGDAGGGGAGSVRGAWAAGAAINDRRGHRFRPPSTTDTNFFHEKTVSKLTLRFL